VITRRTHLLTHSRDAFAHDRTLDKDRAAHVWTPDAQPCVLYGCPRAPGLSRHPWTRRRRPDPVVGTDGAVHDEVQNVSQPPSPDHGTDHRPQPENVPVQLTRIQHAPTPP